MGNMGLGVRFGPSHVPPGDWTGLGNSTGCSDGWLVRRFSCSDERDTRAISFERVEATDPDLTWCAMPEAPGALGPVPESAWECDFDFECCVFRRTEAGKMEKGVEEEVEGELLVGTDVGAEESVWADVVDCGGVGSALMFEDSGSAPVLLFWLQLCMLMRVLAAEELEAAEPGP